MPAVRLGRANPRRGRSPAVAAIVAPFAILAFAVAVGTVAADREVRQEGLVGRHALADIQDSPGAVCAFVLPGRGSLGETWLRVNPPIVYAHDATAGEDHQRVGWRAKIARVAESGEERPVRDGPWRFGEASDRVATYFDGDPELLRFDLAAGHFAVTVEMVWYDPADPALVSGRALRAVERYALQVVSGGRPRQAGVADECAPPG